MTERLTKRQRKDLDATVRHLGLALRALDRAGIAPPTSSDPEWPWSLNEAMYLTAEASNRLIDAIEGENGTTP